MRNTLYGIGLVVFLCVGVFVLDTARYGVSFADAPIVGSIERQGTNLFVKFVNPPTNFVMEWANELVSPVWSPYIKCEYVASDMLPFKSFGFPVSHHSQTQGVWRLRGQ